MRSSRNHTGTHLLHAALREVLGTHVKQAGSLVMPTRLRFDFSHFTAVADEELQEIEDIVNRQVLANTKVETLVDVPIDVAVNEYDAMALFGEKYGEQGARGEDRRLLDRALRRHAYRGHGRDWAAQADGRGSVSSGVRRVEAVSGTGALGEFRRGYEAALAVLATQPMWRGVSTWSTRWFQLFRGCRLSPYDEALNAHLAPGRRVRSGSAARVGPDADEDGCFIGCVGDGPGNRDQGSKGVVATRRGARSGADANACR